MQPANVRVAAHLPGFAFLGSGQLLGRGLTFVTVTYLARVLGVEMFGIVGFAAVITTYLLPCVEAGLDLIGIREIARREASTESIVSAVLVARLALSVLAGLLLWLASRWLAPSPSVASIILAYGLTLVSLALSLKWGFQALEANGLVAVTLVVSQAAYLGGTLALVKGPEDALRVPVLLFTSEMIGSGVLLVQYRRRGFRLQVPPNAGLAWALLRTAFPLAAMRVIRTLQLNFDLLLLGYVDSVRIVGVYVAVSRIALLLREFGDTYFRPMFPELSTAAKQNADRFTALARTGLRYAAVIAFPITIGGCMTASELISLVFGSDYAPGAGALCILLGAVLLSMLTGTYRMGLIAHGREKVVLAIALCGTGLNVVLNVVLIPRFSITGAALSAVASEGLIFIFSVVALSRSVQLPPWRPILGPAIATAGMVLTLWLLPGRHLAVTVASGAAVYVSLAFIVGAVRKDELVGSWQARRRSAAPEGRR